MEATDSEKIFFRKSKTYDHHGHAVWFSEVSHTLFYFFQLENAFFEGFFLARVFEKKITGVIFSIFVHFQKLGKLKLVVGWT